MSATYPLFIGSVEMGASIDHRTLFEAPQEITDGIDVHLGIHQFIDETGQPVIRTHPMGAFPLPQTWSGEFYGATSISRHTLMKITAARMQEVQITVGPLKWMGIIQHYEGKIKHSNSIDYTITIKITKDLNGTSVIQGGDDTQFSIATQQFVDQNTTVMQTALANPLNTIPTSIVNAHSNLLSLLSGASPIQNQTLTTVQNLQKAVNTTVNTINAYTGPLLGKTLPTQVMGDLNTLNVVANNYSLLSKNLGTLAGTGQASTQVQLTAGANLIKVAAKYYPSLDPVSTAVAISQANNLNGLFTTGPALIKIPPVFNNGQ